jgi:DNA replication protein DnaC
VQKLTIPQRLQRNMISVSENRCPNCQRKLMLKGDKEHCFYCEVIAPEDIRVSEEVNEWIKNREVDELLSSFREKSLMNRDLEEATLENYQPQNYTQIEALNHATQYVESFDKKRGLLFFGRPGLGKSHLAASVVKKLIEQKYTGIFISLPRLMTELKATYSKKSELSEIEILKALQKVDLLVLDDLGVERDGKDEASTWAKSKVYEIVDSRIGQATIFTTNFTGKELLGMYGERDFSRMVQNCNVVKMDGKNYRLKDFK